MLLTRLPIRGTPTAVAAQAAWAWPVAGVAVAGLASVVGVVLITLGLLPGLAAALTLLLLVMLTGAMHEDGLADFADGAWGGFTQERRLEIMRDSRIGTYGVIALVLSLLIRWLLLTEAAAQGTLLVAAIAAAMGSRAAMPVMMRWLPNARADGMSRSAGVPSRQGMLAGLALASIPILLFGPSLAVPAIVIAAVLFATLGRVARAKLGGQTGDVLGATQQVVEMGLLIGLVAL
ncbi:MAG: adenosylcobinamide-GDP ribazoletransferase [Pseudomonadota bacterium]